MLTALALVEIESFDSIPILIGKIEVDFHAELLGDFGKCFPTFFVVRVAYHCDQCENADRKNDHEKKIHRSRSYSKR
jgi:hypothetical protein